MATAIDLTPCILQPLVLHLPLTSALVHVRCPAMIDIGVCNKLLYVGQILGIIHIRCGRCHALVHVEPIHPSCALAYEQALACGTPQSGMSAVSPAPRSSTCKKDDYNG